MNKLQIVIVYFSKGGTTEQLAQAIARGAASQDCDAELLAICSKNIVNGHFKDKDLFKKLLNANAIVFGTPTYMGGVAAQFKAFADASSRAWSQGAWANKLAGGFTTGTSRYGEQHGCLDYLFILAQQQGMLWVGMNNSVNRNENPNGCSTGLITQNIDGHFTASELASAEHYGRHIAQRARQYYSVEHSNSNSKSNSEFRLDYFGCQ